MELSILLILVIVICSCKPEVSEEEADFSNSWAVEIHGGLEVADDLAKKHGFINKGQVGFRVFFKFMFCYNMSIL